MQFSDFALSEGVVSGLSARGITEPTPIQIESLPHTLAGKDARVLVADCHAPGSLA
jgi:ATP-dependent RNA helicase DeaD